MASKVLFLALTLLAVALAAPEPESRIVGGTPTTIEQFPYIVAFVYFYPGPGIYIQRCVGSLVSSYHVLTTAYCFTGANLNNMLIRAGSTHSLSGGTLSTIRKVTKHPDYVETPRAADIAVTHLAFPLPLSETVQVLYLPPQQWYIPDGTQVKIVSWGFESESGPQIETLKTVNLFKLPLAQCQELYKDIKNVTITDPMICASGKGSGMCLGDSGAPMVTNNVVVVGLSSHSQDCGGKYPDVFTRIDRFTDWIMEEAYAPGRNGINRARIASNYGEPM